MIAAYYAFQAYASSKVLEDQINAPGTTPQDRANALKTLKTYFFIYLFAWPVYFMTYLARFYEENKGLSHQQANRKAALIVLTMILLITPLGFISPYLVIGMTFSLTFIIFQLRAIDRALAELDAEQA